MFRTSRKKAPRKPISYFSYIDDLFKDRQKAAVPLLFKLTRRTVLFLSLSLLVSLIFYGMGNYQGFLDENLGIVVLAVRVTSFFLLFFSVAGVVQSIVYMADSRVKSSTSFPLHVALMSISAAASLLSLLLFTFIDILSMGISA